MLRYTDFPVRPVSDTVNAHVLAAATPEADTIPTGAKFVVIKTTGPAFFRVGATAAVPADTTNGSSSELIDVAIPTVLAFYNATTRGFVTAGSAALTVLSTDGLTVGNGIIVAGAGTAGADHSTTISAIDQTTKIVTLGAAAVTTVVDATVTSTPTTISLVSAGTPTVTLSYYR